MSGLRRDLIERRLGLVVIVLVAAVVAVPFLLHGHADGVVNVPPPPVGSVASTATVTSASSAEKTSEHPPRVPTVPAAVAHAETTRDAFAPSSTPRERPHRTSTSSTSGSGATSAGASTSTTGSIAAGVTGSLTSDPPTIGSVPTSISAPTNTSAPTSTQTTTVTVTTTAAASTPTPTATATTPATPLEPAGKGPWTAYAVDVRIGARGHLASRTDLARLSPLPSVASPKAMFTGVFGHGRAAVFSLGTGVHGAGPARCQPTHAECSAISLAPGHAEQLSWFASDGSIVTELLSVSRIAARTTSSRAKALAAFDRHSRAGQCELDLADPVQYNVTSGTLSGTLRADCGQVRHAVPFPGPLTGS